MPLQTARNEEELILRKWALMWRSIISSTLDKTYLPYYSYIRYLDLNDLGELLRDPRFTGSIRELVPLAHYIIGCTLDLNSEFFSQELYEFLLRGYEFKGNKRLRSSNVFPDSNWILIQCGSGLSCVICGLALKLMI